MRSDINGMKPLKSLFFSEKSEGLINERTNKAIKSRERKNFGLDILLKLISSDFYKDLKDIGSAKRTYSERMYDELINLAFKLKSSSFDIAKALKEKEMTDILGAFGISEDELTRLYADEIREYERSEAQKEQVRAEIRKAKEEKILEKELKELEDELTDEELDEIDAEVKAEIEAELKKPLEKDKDQIAEEKVKEKVEEKVKEKVNDKVNENKEPQVRQYFELDPIEIKENVVAPEKGTHTKYGRTRATDTIAGPASYRGL